MTQTKKQSIGRGRPKKSFNNTSKKVEIEVSQNDVVIPVRGRPKKSRRIDDSINTKIDNQKKSIAKIQKENDRISNQIGVSTFCASEIKKSNGSINEIEFNDSKKADKFSLIVLICAMLFFIFALFKTFFLNKSIDNLNIQDLSNIDNNIENDIEREPLDSIQKPQIDEPEIINEDTSDYLGNSIDIIEGTNISDEQIILNFYGYMNSLSFDNISNSVDKYLRNSDVFRTYFTQNWLTNFYNKIDKNGLNISDITLKSGDGNTTRYYSYQITYFINQEKFQEEREAAIVNRNDKELIGSLKCVTTGCSKMPFFQK